LHREAGTYAPSRAAARTTAAAALGPDPGVGNSAVRKRVQSLLNKDFQNDGEILREIDHIARQTQRFYLSRWADALDAGGLTLGAERTSRLLAAHMLDVGVSPGALHRWWTRWGVREPQNFTLAQLLRKVDAELIGHSETFRVAVLCTEKPTVPPPNFVAPDGVPDWLESMGAPRNWLNGRYKGGLEFSATATDPGAAVAIVQAQIENIQARLVVGADARAGSLAVYHKAKVSDGPFLRLQGRRKVEVHAIERSGQVYAPSTSHPLESALALVTQLELSAPTAAIAAGWASLETVLKAPEDSGAHLVAGRLAKIVACSVSRGELTTLSYHRRQRAKDALGAILDAEPDNESRSALLLDVLAAGVELADWSAGDKAGIARMRQLVKTPSKVLRDFVAHLEAAIVRLYRQRNIVMHGGKQDQALLQATLRVVAPLVGVGFDRMSHAYFVHGVSPLDLAAQASHQLQVADALTRADLTRLLE